MLLREDTHIFYGDKQIGLKELLTTNPANYTNINGKLARKLFMTGVMDIMEVVSAAISFCLSLLYIVGTYMNDTTSLIIYELSLSMTLVGGFFFRMLISESKLNFLINPYSLIEYCSLIPTIVRDLLFSESPFLKYSKVLNIVSCVRLESFFSRKNKIILKRIYSLSCLVLSLLLVFGCAILEIENFFYDSKESIYLKVKPKLLQFHDILYFTIVTIGTLGYGDIVPKNVLSKTAVYLMIIMMLVMIPSSMNNLLNALKQKSPYEKIMYDKSGQRHIILMGNFNSQALQTFLEELYHPDHKCVNLVTIIIRDEPPSNEMKLLISQELYKLKIVYMQGNPLSEEALKRARAHAAICAIIMTKKMYNEQSVDEDYTIMQWVLSIRSYCKSKKKKQIRICVQVNSPISKAMFKYTSTQNHQYIDQVICTEQLKLKLIAKNCTCPGIISIIASLLTSSIPNVIEGYPTELNDANKSYAVLCGMQCEIYRIILKGENYGGYCFKDIVAGFFTAKQVILFALEVDMGNIRKVFVNPSEFLLEYKNYYAYVIDEKMPDIEEINSIEIEFHKRTDYMACQKPSAFNNYKERDIYKGVFTSNEDMLRNTRNNYYTVPAFTMSEKSEIYNTNEKNIKSHIILCGYTADISIFISTLRSKILGANILPIVILTTDKGIWQQWDKIKLYEEVFILKGSALSVFDLDRAGIREAKVVVILTQKENTDSKIRREQESETIFIYKTIKNFTKKVSVITEVKEATNISFLLGEKDDQNLKKYGYWTTDPLAYGELYLSYFLDTLICQAFYNPFIEDIIEQFVLGSSNSTIDDQKLYASVGLSQCSLFLFNPLSSTQASISYGEMFDLLMEKYKMIAIGIYKHEFCIPKKFVLIHPPKSQLVTPLDDIYVLYKNEPSSTVHVNSKTDVNLLTPYRTLTVSHRLRNKSLKSLEIPKSPFSPVTNELNSLRTVVRNLHSKICHE